MEGAGLARPGGGAKTRGARGGASFGINDPIFVESHTTINLDGRSGSEGRHQAAAEDPQAQPPQKRGPNVRR